MTVEAAAFGISCMVCLKALGLQSLFVWSVSRDYQVFAVFSYKEAGVGEWERERERWFGISVCLREGV